MPREIFLWSVFYRSDKIIIIKILILWWPNYIMLNCSQVKKALSMKFLIQKQRISKNQWLEFPGKEIHIANFVKICCDCNNTNGIFSIFRCHLLSVTEPRQYRFWSILYPVHFFSKNTHICIISLSLYSTDSYGLYASLRGR